MHPVNPSQTSPPKKRACSATWPAAPTEQAAHEHQWVRTGGSAADCTHDGAHVYTCTVCGAEYLDAIPAMGHHYEQVADMPATCENGGYAAYQCTVCGDAYTDFFSALDHNYVAVYSQGASCTENGYVEYACSTCGGTYTETTEYAYGHYFGYCAPTPGNETMTHTWYCINAGCSESYEDLHDGGSPCGQCGYTGALG